MKIGSVHYATHSGLGVLAKEYFDNGVITDVLIKHHFKFATHREWYPDAEVIDDASVRSAADDKLVLEEFIRGLDVLFVFESPWYKETLELAVKHKVPVACMPMYEWSPYPMHADVYIAVSLLDYDYYRTMYPGKHVVMIPVPANSQVKWQKRERALTFLHNGGNGSMNDRNGTRALIDALPFIESPIKLKLRAQGLDLPPVEDERVELINTSLSFDELWGGSDVFLFVERFAGLSLPLQEAFCSGMMIIAGDRYPINRWLPVEPLVKPTGYEQLAFTNVPFSSALYDPRDIAAKIDQLYDTDISAYSLAGKKWAEENSWAVLAPVYLDLLRSLVA